MKQAATWLKLQGELADAHHAYADMRERAENAERALERSASGNLALRAELADVHRRVERAEAALAAYEQQQWMARAIGAEAAEERMLTERAAARTPCVWTQNDDDDDQCWSTSCGELHVLLNGGVPTDQDNRYRGCPHCVRPIQIREG